MENHQEVNSIWSGKLYHKLGFSQSGGKIMVKPQVICCTKIPVTVKKVEKKFFVELTNRTDFNELPANEDVNTASRCWCLDHNISLDYTAKTTANGQMVQKFCGSMKQTLHTSSWQQPVLKQDLLLVKRLGRTRNCCTELVSLESYRALGLQFIHSTGLIVD